MTTSHERIAQNLRGVQDRIAAACRRAGRDPASVRLVAVTKYAQENWVQALLDLGMRDLGESRPQQLVERAGRFQAPVHWHLIGPLQRNKARRVLPVAACIHSVDSLRLLHALERLAAETLTRPRLLLEVNISAETQKHGFSEDELVAGWSEVAGCRGVEIAGLMTMAPYDAPPEVIRGVFRRLRGLRDRLGGPAVLPELSMGMSGDFELAIEEGATIVRVGSLLFEGLDAPAVH